MVAPFVPRGTRGRPAHSGKGCGHPPRRRLLQAVEAHRMGDLAEVLDNLGVFRTAPGDLLELCPSGFRRVPIATGPDYYLSLQGFAPGQVAYAHTHPDSEEWVVVL